LAGSQGSQEYIEVSRTGQLLLVVYKILCQAYYTNTWIGEESIGKKGYLRSWRVDSQKDQY